MSNAYLNIRCKGCGFVRGRHAIVGLRCPKSRKRDGKIEIPGMRFIIKGEYMKRRTFK